MRGGGGERERDERKEVQFVEDYILFKEQNLISSVIAFKAFKMKFSNFCFFFRGIIFREKELVE